MVNVYKTSSSEIKSSSSTSTSSNSAIQDIENGETVDIYSNKVRINHSVYTLQTFMNIELSVKLAVI